MLCDFCAREFLAKELVVFQTDAGPFFFGGGRGEARLSVRVRACLDCYFSETMFDNPSSLRVRRVFAEVERLWPGGAWENTHLVSAPHRAARRRELLAPSAP